MSLSNLSFLQPPCRLQLLWNTSAGEQAAYSGHLRGVTDDRLDVHLLGYGLVPCTLRTGEPVAVHVPMHDGVFEIPSRVLSEDLCGDLLVEVTGEVRRLDRRRYPRVRVSMAPSTAFIPAETRHPPVPITVRVVELSGGGAKLESFTPLEMGQTLQIMIQLPGEAPIFPTAIVLESERALRTHITKVPERHLIRVEFTAVLSDERRTLLRYVADEAEQATRAPA